MATVATKISETTWHIWTGDSIDHPKKLVVTELRWTKLTGQNSQKHTGDWQVGSESTQKYGKKLSDLLHNTVKPNHH